MTIDAVTETQELEQRCAEVIALVDGVFTVANGDDQWHIEAARAVLAMFDAEMDALRAEVNRLTDDALAKANAKLRAIGEMAAAWQARAKFQFEFAKSVPAEVRPAIIDDAANTEDVALKILAILEPEEEEQT